MTRPSHRTTMASYDELVLLARDDLAALAGLAGAVTRSDVALVALLDESQRGFRQVAGCAADEGARLRPLCQYVMLSRALREVTDLDAHDAFAGMSLREGVGVRSFAGRALADASGRTVGMCAVFHRAPRSLDDAARTALGLVIDRVEQQLRQRAELEALRDKHRAQLAELDLLRGVMRAAVRFAIVGTDTRGVVTTYNEGAEAILGWRARDVVGRCTPARFHTEAALRARVEGPLPRAEAERFAELSRRARDGAVDAYECAWRRRDDSEVDVAVVISAARNEEGELTGYVVIAHDVSERRAVERLRSEFMASVSHELRTPLTAIRGALGLIEGGVAGPGSPVGDEMVRVAHANSLRLSRLVDDLLDVTRMDAGRHDFQMRPCALGPLVEGALAANRPLTDEAGVTLALQGPTPEVTVRADPDRVAQVITNLLSNAVRFSPRGAAVTVRVLARESVARVEVTDEGPGVPEAWRARIFDKFVRVDPSAPRGTGLGLHIVRSIVAGHGGHVGVAPNAPRGSTFWFELPTA